MFKLMQGASALTLAAVLALGPVAAVAQTATDDTTGAQTGAQTDPLPPPAEGDVGTDTADAGDGFVAPLDGAIEMQDPNTVLASSLMGARIYNSADESVGQVDDLIVSHDGTVEGVVIGVGGFLGIGARQVAVEMDQIDIQADAAGAARIHLETNRDALQAAPEFVTVAEQARRQEPAAVQPTQGMTGTDGGVGTGTAPPATD